jgi:hypothetical protein
VFAWPLQCTADHSRGLQAREAVNAATESSDRVAIQAAIDAARQYDSLSDDVAVLEAALQEVPCRHRSADRHLILKSAQFEFEFEFEFDGVLALADGPRGAP